MPWFQRRTQNGSSDTAKQSAAGSRDLESRTCQIGRELIASARGHHAGLLSSRFWSDRLMRWAMEDPAFKVQLFRFIDVFPTLATPEQVHDYLADYLSQPNVSLPWGMQFGLKAGGLAKTTLTRTIAAQIESMAGNFIAGRDVAAAIAKLERRWNDGLAFSVDLLGEACVSDEEARQYQRRYLDLIESLAPRAAAWPPQPRLEHDHLGPIPRTNVSIKISALSARADPIDFEGSIAALVEALRPLLEAARTNGVFINFDMEQHALKDLTLELFERCCDAVEFPAGLAVQAYLRDAEGDVQRIITWSKRTGRQVTVRLIKGAYWDYEVAQAELMGWPAPVWTDKSDTDACFERMTETLVEAMPRSPGEGGVKLAIGSHNARSIARTLALLEHHDLPPDAAEFQMLYGMADELKAALVERELRVREYVPLGEMIPGMAYLVRRLLENTSNQSWLRAGFIEQAAEEDLLATPHRGGESPDSLRLDLPQASPERHRLSPAVADLGDGRPFFNEPPRDFSQADQRARFAEAVRSAPLASSIATVGADEVNRAVARADAAFPAWRGLDAVDRCSRLIGAAALMRRDRDGLAGRVLRESGKTWREADADVCEAIDFLEYYARSAVPLFRPRRLGRLVGELDETWYQPRGVAAVLSPWNFPLAILTGMTAAALATGNTAVVKPSSQTRGIARAMCEILWKAGVPADVLQFLPGSGGAAGTALVRHPRVALIAFTGSKQVGLDILATAAQPADGQQCIKKVVCEMGGKNAIIIDDSADLDLAVPAVRQSAFGYSGQKCSACSRVIVLESVYETFLRRLIAATRSLVIGDPLQPGTDIGPVIDESAAAKIREYIAIGQGEGRLELACDVPAWLEEKVGKPYVGPHIFSAIEPHHRLAREEIFGPVLSVMRCANFRTAIDLANNVEYKLTGGVFSRKPSHLELARREFRVGNLYLNRGITGAIVGRQPFGGFGLSGTGTKAGGEDYLLHFVEPRACSENTLRHGFAPGIEGDA